MGRCGFLFWLMNHISLIVLFVYASELTFCGRLNKKGLQFICQFLWLDHSSKLVKG